MHYTGTDLKYHLVQVINNLNAIKVHQQSLRMLSALKKKKLTLNVFGRGVVCSPKGGRVVKVSLVCWRGMLRGGGCALLLLLLH